MKKFFKALALVLALALVIGVVPAQATSAKIKAKKTLYVDGAKGKSTDGKLTSGYKGRVAIYKLAGDKKADADGHTYKAVIKSGDSVTKTKRYVYADNLGKSVVEIFKDGESLGTSVITVKKNATADTLTITGFEDGQEVVCGVKTTVTLPRYGVDSDERRLFVDDKAYDEVEGQPRVYEVVFKKAGDHKIRFEAFQGGNLDANTTDPKEITVKAIMPQPVSAKQVSANSVDVTFSASMKDLIDPATITASNIYYLIADQHVVTGVVKEVKVSEEDPSVVTITRYTNFVEGETYYFEYGDSQPVSFKIASNKLTEVDSIKLVVADHYYVGKTTPITIKYYNKDGVELDVSGEAAPTIDINSEVAFPDGDGIWFTAEGKATIKASVIIDYDEDTFVPIEKTDSIEVTGIQETAVPATSVDYSFGADASKNVHYIRLKDANAALNATFKDANGKTLATYTSGDTGYYLKSTSEDIVQIAAGNTVTGVNIGSAMILLCYTEDGKEQVTKAFPIEVKEANKATTNITAALDQNTLNVFDIDTLTSGVDANDEVILKVKVLDLNGVAYANNLTYTIKQVANNAASVGVVLEPTVAKDWIDDGEFEVAFDLNNVTPVPGTYANSTYAKNGTGRVAFELTVKEGSTTLATKTFSFVVGEINPDAPGTGVNVGYRLNASNTALDISRKNFKDSIENLDNAIITIQKTGTKNQSQFYLGTTEASVIKSLNDIPVSVATSTSINYVVATTPYTAVNNIVNANSGNMFNFSANPNNISLTDLHDIAIVNFVDEDVVSADDVAKAGTYSFVGVRVNYNTADTANPGQYKQTGQRINIGTVNVVVSGKDETASYTEKAGLTAAILQGIIDNAGTDPVTGKTLYDCYKITWDGINSDDISTENAGRVTFVLGDYKADTTTKSVYVYKLTVTLKPYENGTGDMAFTQDITINKLYKDK